MDPKGTNPTDPASYEAIREAVASGDTLVGYERRNGLRGLWSEFYSAELELGLAADIAPSLFEADGTPKGKRIGPAILAARADGVRWSRIATYLGLAEADVRKAATKAGLAEDHYVGLGRRYGREGTKVRKGRKATK